MAKKAAKKMNKTKKKTVKQTIKRTTPTTKIVCGPCEKFSIRSFALAFGVVYAVIMAVFALAGMYGMEGTTAMMGEVFPGYGASPMGIVIAALWGLLMGCVFGGLIAWLYNLFT